MKRRGAFILWITGIILVGGALTAVHELPLEVSTPAREAPATPTWSMVHVLSTKCGCSKRILQHLVGRHVSADADVRERVVLIDATDEWRTQLEGAGFEVEAQDAAQLAQRIGVDAAPTLVVRRPDGSLAYSGAYAPKRGAPPRDLELLARARAGETLDGFPLFGCAVSRELQERSDPLRLKYGN
jgi:hypothetical protein